MAVNQSRSMTMDLFEGISDGVVKKLTPDRGGVTDSRAAAIAKGDLHESYDAIYSSTNMMNAASRIAYDRSACTVCGGTGCSC